MSNCISLSGWPQDCVKTTGGLKDILIADFTSVASVTPVVGATSDQGIITTITMAAPLGVTASFYQFIPNSMSSKFDETAQSNEQNGTDGWDQVITLMFAKNEAAKRNGVKSMSGRKLIAIVHDFNDKYWLVGEFNGVRLTANSSTGQAITDMNGWTLTLTGHTNEPAREVSSSIISGLYTAGL